MGKYLERYLSQPIPFLVLEIEVLGSVAGNKGGSKLWVLAHACEVPVLSWLATIGCVRVSIQKSFLPVKIIESFQFFSRFKFFWFVIVSSPFQSLLRPLRTIQFLTVHSLHSPVTTQLCSFTFVRLRASHYEDCTFRNQKIIKTEILSVSLVFLGISM